MAALNIDLTIPLGDGSIRFAASIPDLELLCDTQRQALADTARDFAEFAAGTIAPPAPRERETATLAEVKRDVPDVLRGVDGGRAGGRA